MQRISIWNPEYLLILKNTHKFVFNTKSKRKLTSGTWQYIYSHTYIIVWKKRMEFHPENVKCVFAIFAYLSKLSVWKKLKTFKWIFFYATPKFLLDVCQNNSIDKNLSPSYITLTLHAKTILLIELIKNIFLLSQSRSSVIIHCWQYVRKGQNFHIKITTS